nr:HNH endonuclease signature motif containing protein [Halomonas sp.]
MAEKDVYETLDLTDTEKHHLKKARVGQGLFRGRLISLWDGCCLTGCDHISVLRASHIQPWRDSTNQERLDAFNGLLLLPNLDALFDRGLISFNNKGEIMISKVLSDSARKALRCSVSMKVDLRAEHTKYMTWHRENVFVDAMA